MTNKRKTNSNEDKQVENFNKCLIEQYIQNANEKDKQLLGLSSLAIGLLATFINQTMTCLSFILWFLSGIFFIITIISTLKIFEENKKYTMSLYNNSDCKEIEGKLGILDFCEYWSFIIGTILLFILSIILNCNIKCIGG